MLDINVFGLCFRFMAGFLNMGNMVKANMCIKVYMHKTEKS